jgi:Electron transfer DM13
VAIETEPDVQDTAAPTRTDRPGRRKLWFVAVTVVIGLAAFVVAWFEPHKLFIDERVDQAVPTAAPTTTAAQPDEQGAPSEASVSTAVPPAPVDLRTGSFVSLDHTTTGTVRVLELADGRRFVRLEGFETDNGPDLYVYFSANSANGSEGAFDDDFANLGRLQGNIGDQNYEIPSDVDPARYASVVIWCDRFDAAFGAADLTPQP